MHSALLVVERPADTPQGPSPIWRGFLSDTAHLRSRVEKGNTLAESTWQIPLANGLDILVGLVSIAVARGMPHHVLFFPEVPTWCRSTSP